MRKGNGQHDDVVAVGEVNGFHIQVLRTMTARGADYVYRILKDDKIVKYADDVYDTIETAFDAAVVWIIPDAEPLKIDDIPQEMFTELNVMLVGNIGGGEIKTLAEAVIAHEELSINFEEAKKEAQGAALMMAGITRSLIDLQGPMSKDALDAIALSKLLEHCLNVVLNISNRDITVLSTFIAACLGDE